MAVRPSMTGGRMERIRGCWMDPSGEGVLMDPYI